jgi:hypothetical protein
MYSVYKLIYLKSLNNLSLIQLIKFLLSLAMYRWDNVHDINLYYPFTANTFYESTLIKLTPEFTSTRLIWSVLYMLI